MIYIETTLEPCPTHEELERAGRRLVERLRTHAESGAWLLELDSLEPFELERIPHTEECALLIRARVSCIRVAREWGLGEGWFLIVDDDSMAAPFAILNPLASVLHNTGAPICNRAILIHDPRRRDDANGSTHA